MTEPDAILLEGLRVECIIGDLPHERTFPQELFLDLELICDLRPAGRSDALADTVNYVAVAEAVRSALTEARCQLVERAAPLAPDAPLKRDYGLADSEASSPACVSSASATSRKRNAC